MTENRFIQEPVIGILGGTFDPVHYGHLRAAVEACEKLGLDDMRLMPAGSPPHRVSTHASGPERLEMLQLALRDSKRLWADAREVRRAGPSYMSVTLGEFRAEYPSASLILLIGQDAANQLDSWHRWTTLFDLAHIVIMRRPDSVSRYSGELAVEIRSRQVDSAIELLRSPAGKVLPLELTQLAISSTDIRNRVSNGKSVKYLLPDAVIAYIEKNDLYSRMS